MAACCATVSGTQEYFRKVPISLSKQKKIDGLAVSALGAGTYLGLSDDATDEQYLKILVEAGLGGVNIFDTAVNYRGQRSERILGKALKALDGRGFPRSSFVVGTKGGFFPCEGSPESFDEYVRVHFLDTGIVAAQEIAAGIHCMSPAFLETQIETSLGNLQIECIDQYFLHNPEVQLRETGEEIFYKRLEKAFQLFEKKVEEKKIARYGLATWDGFRQKKGSLQLAQALQCAKNAGGEEHHFKSIQIPFNLVMLEGISMKNQLFGKEKLSVLEAARQSKIAVMVSSPLMQGQVKLLCSRVFESLPKEESRMIAALQFVLSTPQISTAFIGMKDLAHWMENQKGLLQDGWSLAEWTAACAHLGIVE